MKSNKIIWGAATASYQIEGGAYEDGKGLSIWDVACKRKNFVFENQNGDIACDHYHRYKEDVLIMKQLGLEAYRFSISWSRIFPEGNGKINKKGIAFYNNLIDELLKNGIEPFVTMFHWDYPHDLQRQGGWQNPDSPKWFAEYAKVLVDNFSDRVKYWFTINEPQCIMEFGYHTGRIAPAISLGHKDAFQAAHNLLLAHGLAVDVVRKFSKQNAKVGIATQGHTAYPKVITAANIKAAKKSMFEMDTPTLGGNVWWLDAIYLGRYPDSGLHILGSDAPNIKQNDMKIISAPLDFFAYNNYGAYPVIADNDGNPITLDRQYGHPENAREWPIDFESLYWGPKTFYERYGLPIIIAENGVPLCDWVCLDGGVHDGQRIDYLKRNINELIKANNEGVPIAGYFVWSLMDNMEWLTGFAKRFGIVYVDYETQKRTIKDSGYWYSDFIKNQNGMKNEFE